MALRPDLLSHVCPTSAATLSGYYSARNSSDLKLYCKPCTPGTFQDAPGQSSCKSCDIGTSTDGLAGRDDCSPCQLSTFSDHQGASSCSPCPASFLTLGERSRSIVDCKCSADKYGDATLNASGSSPTCSACPNLFTSAAGSLSRDACSLGTTATLMIVVCAVGIVLVVAMGIWVFRLRRKAAQAEKVVFDAAITAASELHYPMVLIPAQAIIDDAGWLPHERVRSEALNRRVLTTSKLLYLDTLDDVTKFLEAHFVVFFSHRTLTRFIPIVLPRHRIYPALACV
jgi:hypothetical protein